MSAQGEEDVSGSLGHSSIDSTVEVTTSSPLYLQFPLEDRQHLLGSATTFEGALGRRSSSISFSNEDQPNFRFENGSIEENRGSLTYLNGLALVIGLQIGSGIFSAPSQVNQHVSSAAAGVLVWLVGGILVWTGAASFIELGGAIPRNGGIQEYLRHCYGDYYGFMFAWIWVSISKPCSVAIIAIIFAEHLNGAILPDYLGSVWVNKFIAITGLALITFMNCLGKNTGARIANGFLVLKLVGLFSIALTGLVIGLRGQGHGVGKNGEPGWFGDMNPHGQDNQQERDIWTEFGEYVTALFGALFCYGGWESVGFVAGEMKNPLRDLPRVINSAMAIVISGFVLMNVALYIVLPMAAIREKDMVAVTFGTSVFGPVGGLVYSLIVALSCLGALNANIFATGRLCVAASRRHYFPQILGDPGCSRKEEESAYYRHALRYYPPTVTSVLLWIAKATEHVRWEMQVPVYAIVLNSTIASFYIIIGSFSLLVTFIGISEYIFFFFAALGVFVLRSRAIPSEAILRTWAVNPIIFCTISGFLVMRGIVTSPIQGLMVFIFIILGWVIRHLRANSV